MNGFVWWFYGLAGACIAIGAALKIDRIMTVGIVALIVGGTLLLLFSASIDRGPDDCPRYGITDAC
jgi:hypothetical protein